MSASAERERCPGCLYALYRAPLGVAPAPGAGRVFCRKAGCVLFGNIEELLAVESTEVAFNNAMYILWEHRPADAIRIHHVWDTLGWEAALKELGQLVDLILAQQRQVRWMNEHPRTKPEAL